MSGAASSDDLDAPLLGVEIGHQDLDNDRRVHRPNGFDGARKMIRAAILKIIPRDSGNDDMLQTHPTDGLSDALRFVLFQRQRFGGADRAKPTGAGAALACNHHRRGALAPAFPAVRALRALADGVQAQIRDERFRRKENRVRGQPHFDPGRFLRLVQGRIDFRAGHQGRKSDM